MTALLTHLRCILAGGCCLHTSSSAPGGTNQTGRTWPVTCCRCTFGRNVEVIPPPRGDCDLISS